MNKLTFTSIKDLFPGATTRSYAKNQIICYQGDKPQHVFFVVKGHIKYYDISENGNEKVLHIIGPDNIFPMLYAFNVSDEIGAFYSTIDKVELIAIPIGDFRHETETNIKFCNQLTRWFLTEIEQLVFRINSFEKTDAKSKILHSLKYLALNYGEETRGKRQLNFTVTQQFIADFTGLTRETVSATMNDLENAGSIRTVKGRRIEIKNEQLENIV